MTYDQIYSHDYHGWRDTKSTANEAFNVFQAVGSSGGQEVLHSVSFYTTIPNAEYEVKVFGTFAGGELTDALSQKDGVTENVGFHTIDLNWPVTLTTGQNFYVYVKTSGGGHAFDRTSDVPVLLGATYRTTVESRAKAGESFYRTSSGGKVLTQDDPTANFCIKALSRRE